MHFIAQLLITVSSYVILALAYLGTGGIFFRILKVETNNFFLRIWTGWAITLLLLQVIHIFTPINAFISIPIFAAGLIAGFQQIHEGKIKFSASPPAWYFLLLGASTFWIANLSMQAPSVYDSGLYHFNTIRWLNEAPIVLGLGNLHGRLAFNQSFFLYVAQLNIYPLAQFGHTIANGFLLFLLFAESLLCAASQISNAKRHSANFKVSDFTPALLLPVILYLAFRPGISSPTPDTASTILQILIFINFISILEKYFTGADNETDLLLLFIISATAITVKLSNIFFVLTVCIILLVTKPNFISFFSQKGRSAFLKLITIPALIILIWCIRGIMLSGCIAYPSTALCFDTGWAMPIETVKNEADWIYSWARLPEQRPEVVLNSSDWLAPWLIRVLPGNKSTVVYPVLMFLAGMGASSIFLLKFPSLWRKVNHWYMPLVPVLTGLIFWFFMAPDVRFAHALFWLLPVSAAIILLETIRVINPLKPRLILSIFFLLNVAIGLVFIRNIKFLFPFSPEGNLPIPSINIEKRITDSGLEVLKPVSGDQCWDSALPCTPYFNDDLVFIDRPLFPQFSIALEEGEVRP